MANTITDSYVGFIINDQAYYLKGGDEGLSYDENKAEANTTTSFVDYDYLVPSGTECGRVGGIIEYWPLSGKRKDAVRLHALAYWDSGKNTCESGGCIDKQFFMSVGATLRIDFARK